MPAEPVTREAVERWLLAHGWFALPEMDTFVCWDHVIHKPPIYLNDRGVSYRHSERFDIYSDLLLTDDGIYGRIA